MGQIKVALKCAKKKVIFNINVKYSIEIRITFLKYRV